jgi:hypothetical protein
MTMLKMMKIMKTTMMMMKRFTFQQQCQSATLLEPEPAELWYHQQD